MAQELTVIKLGSQYPGSIAVTHNGKEIPNVLKCEVEAEPGVIPVVKLEMMVPEVIVEETKTEEPVKLVKKSVSSKDLPKVSFKDDK